MRLVLFFVIAMSLAACNPGKKTNTSTTLTELQYGCFGYSGDGKTVTLQITETGEILKGNLNYNIVGKAPISGTFEGTLQDNILIGTYTYRLGGIESTRGIAFQVDENGLREGHGILNSDGSSFENPKHLNFTASRQLRPSDCHAREMIGNMRGDSFYSQVQLSLVNPILDGIPLHTLSGPNSLEQDQPAYLIFNEDKSKAEIFFSNQRNSMVLKKTHEGNWVNSLYTLSNWKGLTLYHETTPIFVSEKKEQKGVKSLATSQVLSHAR